MPHCSSPSWACFPTMTTYDADFLAGCAHKAAHATLRDARQALRNQMRAGVKAPPGMCLSVFLCPRPGRHGMRRVFHIGTTYRRRMTRREYRER